MVKVTVGSATGGGALVLDTVTGKVTTEPFIPIERGTGGRGIAFTPTGGTAQQRAQAAAGARAVEESRKQKLLEETRARQKSIREAAQERKRIEDLRNKLIRQKARSKSRLTVDRNTRDNIRLTTLINPTTKERIFTKTNLTTGVTSTRTFERKNGGARQTGGIVFSKEKVEVPKEKVKEGFVTKPSLPKGRVDKLLSTLNRLQQQAQTRSVKTKQKDIKNELKLAGVTAASVLIGNSVALVRFPKTLIDIAKNPSVLKKVPSEFKKEAVKFGRVLRLSPTQAFVQIGSEILFLSGAGKTIRVLGKVSNPTVTKIGLKGKFLKIDKRAITFKTTGKTTTIKLGGSTASLREPLSKQVKLAGKKVTAVSAQADRLVNLIKTKRVIRKPLPNEASLPKGTKQLLSKFDRGIIKKKELIRLNQQVPILERSFFADPRGRFRPRRFGDPQKDATLLDFLAGDVSFRASKPQVLVFRDVRVQKFPKALKDIETSLKKGKKLTASQTQRLIRFQTTPSGLFKPIGKLSREPEITGATNDIVKRVKKVGVGLTRDGRTFDIVLAKLVKAKPTTAKLLKKSRDGKLTQKELKQLRKNLKKETGFNARLSSRRPVVRPRARLPKRAPKRLPRRITRRRKAPRRISRAPPRRPRRIKGVRPRRRAPRRGVRARPRRAIKRPPVISKVGRVVRVSAIAKTIKPIKGLKRKRFRKVKLKKRGKGSFDVFAKPVKGRRLIRINKRPLKETDAKDLRNFIIDTSLSRQGSIKPRKGKPRKPKLKAPRGFARRTSKKFRRFRRRRGRRIPLSKGRVIERRKRLLDTPQERRKITLAKRIKQLTPGVKKRKRVVKNKPKPTLTPTARRRQQLENLAKARAVKKRLAASSKSRTKTQATASSVALRRKISIV